MAFWKKRTPTRSEEDIRPHHYAFAHLALPGYCFADPLRFFAIIASESRGAFLERIWNHVLESQKGPEKPDFTAADVAVTTCRLGDCPTIVFAMPRPRAIAEAHFVAMVLLSDGTEPEPRPSARVFTLEHGQAIGGTERTVLGEWREGSHANMGDGPPADVGAFLGAIQGLLKASAAWRN